ncbi:class I lanthipeptide [Pseudomonas shirazensis]
MKNQSQNNKLIFNKTAVAELNESQLNEVNGGTSIIGGEDTCTGCCCLKITFDLM